LDENGNSREDARSSFPLVVSQGEHRTGDLAGGEEILLVLGLIHLTPNDHFSLTPAISILAKLEDEIAIRCMRSMLMQQTDESVRSEVGTAGEVAVVQACRNDLARLGRSELVRGVQRVSLLSDALGYDIVAPMVTGQMRLLEVKTTKRAVNSAFEFFISRNEFDVGRREPSAWSLVACHLQDTSAKVVGWCRVDKLSPYLPDDGDGYWTEARVRLPRSILLEGIPPAV